MAIGLQGRDQFAETTSRLQTSSWWW